MIYSELSHLPIKKLHPDAVIPTRAHTSDAGLDIYALEDTFIPINTTVVIKTGIAVNIPEGFYGRIASRSSLGSKGLEVGAGVVDSSYTGEIKIVFHNLTNREHWGIIEKAEPIKTLEYTTIEHTLYGQSYGYKIYKGDKIAQLIVSPILSLIPHEVIELRQTDRKDKGFGSTGK